MQQFELLLKVCFGLFFSLPCCRTEEPYSDLNCIASTNFGDELKVSLTFHFHKLKLLFAMRRYVGLMCEGSESSEKQGRACSINIPLLSCQRIFVGISAGAWSSVAESPCGR